MPSSAYHTVSGLVKDNIYHLESAAETCSYIDDVTDLPPAFCTVAGTFLLAQEFFRCTKTSLEGGSKADDELYKKMSPVLTHCKEAATKLDGLLRVVISSESSMSTLDRYRKEATRQGRIEILAKTVLEDMLRLAKVQMREGGGATDLRDLERALDEVSRVPPSLSNADASQHRYINHGPGTMNVNTGNGVQNNNSGTGIQICGGSVQSLYTTGGPWPQGSHDEKPKPDNGSLGIWQAGEG